MPEEKFFTEEERIFVLHWMQKYCYGREHARYREDRAHPDNGILPYMPEYINNRKWRRIISALIHEGHIYSSASWGYFFMPLVNPGRADIEAGMQALEEREQKALSSLEKIGQNRRRLEAKAQGVKELFV